MIGVSGIKNDYTFADDSPCVIDVFTDERASSNWGPHVDLAGPFWALSTVVNDMYQDETSGWCGTSMATPHVAGVAAIVRGEYPELTRDQVAQILFDSANDLGDSGWDEFFG